MVLKQLFRSFVVSLVAAILITLWIRLNLFNSAGYISDSITSISGNNSSPQRLASVALVIMVIVWVTSFSDRVLTDYIYNDDNKRQ